MLIGFILFAVIYLVVATKVTAWQTIYRCGFRSEAPMRYQTNPNIYWTAYVVSFILPIAFAVFQDVVSPWLLIPIMPILFFVSSILGRNAGIKNLRAVLMHIMTDNPDGEQRESIKRDLQLSDLELFRQYAD